MLSKQTKYGLKALGYLARNAELGKVQARVIAEEENISPKFLEAILIKLRNGGYVGAKKGKGGGYYLLKEPQDVTVTNIIRLLEGPIAMVPCVSLNFYEPCEDCKDQENCKIKALMVQVRDSTLSIFSNTTLENLI